MISDAALTDMARLAQTVLTQGIPGSFVECGVWRGGVSFLMAEVARVSGDARNVWLCDSFEGLPPPEEIDGDFARKFAENTESPYYYDNCTASLDVVQRAVAELGLDGSVELVKGWFDQTLPTVRDAIGPISILRLDCDWYASVRCCLDNLFDQVVEGGFIVLDDYYYTDGCAVAIHEFLGERKLGYRIESFSASWSGIERVSGAPTGMEPYVNAYQAAIIRKGGQGTWLELRRAYLNSQDIAAHVPVGGTYVLVDYEILGESPSPGRQAVPLVGSSRRQSRPDNAAMLRAIEAHRGAGVEYLVVAWPAFWWLPPGSQLAESLDARFPRVVDNDNTIVFDIRR
jgi:hypothetical protein